MRFLIHFSYDGSSFHGYQTQPGYRTIQEELENAATKINNGENNNTFNILSLAISFSFFNFNFLI